MPKDHDLEKIHDISLRIALKERSGGLCEVCYKAGPFDDESWGEKAEARPLILHHAWGRDRPRGFKSFPPEIQEWWPHIEPGTLFLCAGPHGIGDRSGRVHAALKHNAPALSALLLLKYWDRIWEGKTYWEWFSGPGPWEGWAKEWAIVQHFVTAIRLKAFIYGDGQEGGYCGPGIQDFLKEALDNHKR